MAAMLLANELIFCFLRGEKCSSENAGMCEIECLVTYKVLLFAVFSGESTSPNEHDS